MTRLSIVLHTHMPYVEGFGTWPFGEEWLWEAIATSYLPLLDVLDAHPGKVTLSITPVLADQLEAPGALERCLTFLREIRPGVARPRRRHGAGRRRSSTRAQRYAAAADALERRGDLLAAFAPARDLDERRHPRRAAAAGHRRRRPAAGRDRDRLAPRALRRLGRRLLAARVRARAVARRAARGGGRAHDLRRLDRRHRQHRRRGAASAGIVLQPLDRAAIDLVWHRARLPVPRRLPRLAPPDRRARTPSGPTTARRTTPSAAPPGPGPTRRTSSRASPDGAVVAFDTELFGHHWHEGVTFLEAVLRAGRRGAARRARRRGRARTPRRPRGARAATCAPGTSSWPGRSARAELAALGAEPSAARPARAARAAELGLGLPDHARHRGRLPARAGRRPTSKRSLSR